MSKKCTVDDISPLPPVVAELAAPSLTTRAPCRCFFPRSARSHQKSADTPIRNTDGCWQVVQYTLLVEGIAQRFTMLYVPISPSSQVIRRCQMVCLGRVGNLSFFNNWFFSDFSG
ncbi:MAG: hypothetical protein ABGX16_25260 [Pirellulales bacterium]